MTCTGEKKPAQSHAATLMSVQQTSSSGHWIGSGVGAYVSDIVQTTGQFMPSLLSAFAASATLVNVADEESHLEWSVGSSPEFQQSSSTAIGSPIWNNPSPSLPAKYKVADSPSAVS